MFLLCDSFSRGGYKDNARTRARNVARVSATGLINQYGKNVKGTSQSLLATAPLRTRLYEEDEACAERSHSVSRQR